MELTELQGHKDLLGQTGQVESQHQILKLA